jgi:hypothetical protein
LVERGGVGRALSRTRYDASDLLAKLVYYAVLLLTLQLAFSVWGPNPVSDMIAGIVRWLPKAAVAIVIVVVAAAIANALRDLISGALAGLTYGRLLATSVWLVTLGLGVIAALNQVGVATTVTTPVLVTVLASIAGILIVGVGGGLIRPMQQRWERWLGRIEAEAPAVSERLRAAAEARREAAAAAAAAAAVQPVPTAADYGLYDDPTMMVPVTRPTMADIPTGELPIVSGTGSGTANPPASSAELRMPVQRPAPAEREPEPEPEPEPEEEPAQPASVEPELESAVPESAVPEESPKPAADSDPADR